MTVSQNDIQKLIDYSVSFAKTALSESKEFYPFAAAINLEGELIPILFYDGVEFPDSKELSTKLESLLENQLADNSKKAYALTTNVAVKRTDCANSQDAISVKIRQTGSEGSHVYFFLYKLNTEKIIEIVDSWGEGETN